MTTRIDAHAGADGQRGSAPPRVAVYNNPKARAVVYQLVLVAAVLWFGYEFALNAKSNLDALNIKSGFGFLDQIAGFGVNQSLIPYNELDTYGRVFFVGLLNTLLVAGVGIVLATVIGFLVGIARLSPNWLLARLGRRLCRAHSQPAAPVPDPVLVSRRARRAAGTAPKHLAVRRDFSQQSRDHPACADGRRRVRRGRACLRVRRASLRSRSAGGRGAGRVAPAAGSRHSGPAWRWWSGCRSPSSSRWIFRSDLRSPSFAASTSSAASG